jgi:membrane-bound ClpP family serine protease
MELAIVIVFMVAAIILLLAEVFLIPGFGLTGIGGFVCYFIAIIRAFRNLGTTAGFITLGISILSITIIFIWLIRSKTLEKLSLKKKIDSTTENPAKTQIKVGNEGITTTRLTLIGNAEINNEIIEVKSADGFIEAQTPIVVSRIQNKLIIVKKK